LNRIDQFVENWGSKATMVPINFQELLVVEEKLSLFLPEAYRYLLSTYGLVHSPNVLTKICDLNEPVSAVQDFLNLEDVISLSKLYEMSGMPKGHVLFASDCQGNMFCFKASDCISKQPDLPVWIFDQAACSVNKVADSFIEWLEGFNAL